MNFKPKICEWCGKEFIPKSGNRKLCYDDHFKPCPICGKPVKWIGFDRCCSRECSRLLRKQNCQAKYGVDDPTQRPEVIEKHVATYKKTMADPKRHKEIVEAHHKTMIERYGTVSYIKSDAWKARKSENVEKWGGIAPLCSPEIRKKCEQTLIERYGSTVAGRSDKVTTRTGKYYKYGKYTDLYKSPNRAELLKELCQVHGVEWQVCVDSTYTKSKLGHKYLDNIYLIYSKTIEEYNLEYIKDYTVGEYTYSYYIPSKNLLIDILITWRDNALINLTDFDVAPVDGGYVRRKIITARKQGYNAIMMYEWDNPTMLSRYLSDITTVAVEECTVEPLNASTANMFFNMYHPAMGSTNVEAAYGVYRGFELVCAMSFGYNRYNKDITWVVSRMCQSFGVHVQGGYSKLLNMFVQEHKPDSIAVYADISKEYEDTYYNMGMELGHRAYSDRVFVRDLTACNLHLGRGRSKYRNIVPQDGNSNEYAIEAGALPVQVCGRCRFEWRSK